MDKREDTTMRTTCLLCVRKHLGKAEALMNEARLGYPAHAGLAIGNLSEAADEAMQDYPEFAAEIRSHWKAYELDEEHYEVPTMELLKIVEILLARVRRHQREDEVNPAAVLLAIANADKRQPPASDDSKDRGKSQRPREGARDRARSS